MSEYPFGFLGEIAKGKRGVSYKPEDITQGTGQKHYRLLTAGNIQDGITTTDSYTRVPTKCVSQEQLISPDDILVCMSNGSKRLVGKSSRLRSIDSKEYCVGAFCSTFAPTGSADPEFVFQIFQSEIFRKQVSDALEGSAINNLKNTTIENFQVPLPPLPEQTKIAEILSGIDKEIYALSTLISLLALGKRNLLHDAAAKEPDQFSVKALGDIASVINGYAFSSSDLEDSSDGIPVIRMSNLKGGAVRYDSALKIQESKASGLERFLLKKGDLLIGMSGSISNTALVTSEKAALLNQRVGALRANDEGSFYHAIAYQSEIAMRQVERMAAGGAQLNISSSQIESVEIPVPSQREIDKITHCWFSMENTIRLYEIKLGRLRSLKSALASDLLSGRKRVSV